MLSRAFWKFSISTLKGDKSLTETGPLHCGRLYDGIPPDQDLTGSHVEYDPIRIYSERADYSKTSKVSEVFGPKIHNKINMFITEYAKMYDEMLASGKKNAASVFENGIKKGNVLM